MKITADFTFRTGRTVKPMHGVGQPPFIGVRNEFMHYLSEAGIPFSRLHDVGGPYGGFRFVDIPNIFRDFDADETLEASYDFTFTDWLITELHRQGCEPIYRLGVTIENSCAMKAYRLDPPKNPAKWARICEHIVRHYNEGWANGFHYGIRYWEIWNEPEGEYHRGGGAMWLGTQEQYFELYDVTSKHLKACFGDSIRVGGYASCGFYGVLRDGDPDCEGFADPKDNYQWWVTYVHDFLKFVRDNGCPLDFFSWHSYGRVHEIVKCEDYARRVLAKYGFENTEDMLNEWNPCHEALNRSTPEAAAQALAVMLAMQKKPVGVMAFYDARMGSSQYGGLFNPDTWQPYRAYYAFMAFNRLYRLGGEIETASDNENVFVGGATDGKKKALLIANVSDKPVDAEIELVGADAADADILMIDNMYLYTRTGRKIEDGRLRIPAFGCVEIDL